MGKIANILIGFVTVLLWAFANEFIHIVLNRLGAAESTSYLLAEVAIVLFGIAAIASSSWLIFGDEIITLLKKRYKIIKIEKD